MLSVRSGSDDDKRNSRNRSPDCSPQAVQSPRLPENVRDSPDQTVTDDYSEAMPRLASASGHMEQPTQSRIYRSTLTIMPTKQDSLPNGRVFRSNRGKQKRSLLYKQNIHMIFKTTA